MTQLCVCVYVFELRKFWLLLMSFIHLFFFAPVENRLKSIGAFKTERPNVPIIWSITCAWFDQCRHDHTFVPVVFVLVLPYGTKYIHFIVALTISAFRYDYCCWWLLYKWFYGFVLDWKRFRTCVRKCKHSYLVIRLCFRQRRRQRHDNANKIELSSHSFQFQFSRLDYRFIFNSDLDSDASVCNVYLICMSI